MRKLITREHNACFIGCMQFIYEKTFDEFISEYTIKDNFKFSDKGVGVKSIIKNAENIGFGAELFEITKDIPFGYFFIAIIERKTGNHFSVIWTKDNDYFMFDPEKGESKIEKPEIGMKVLMFVELEKPTLNKFNLQLDADIKVKKLLLALMGVLLTIVGSYYLKDLLIALDSNQSLSEVLVKFFGLAIIALAISIYHKWITSKAIMYAVSGLLHKFNTIYTGSTIAFKRYFKLARIHQVPNDVSEYIRYEYNLLESVVSMFAYIVAATFILWSISPRLIALTFVIAIMISLLRNLTRPMMVKLNERLRSDGIKYTKTINETYTNYRRAISSDNEYYDQKLMEDKNRLMETNFKISKANIAIEFIGNLFGIVFNKVSVFLVITLVYLNVVDLPNAMFLSALTSMLYTNLIGIVSVVYDHEISSLPKWRVKNIFEYTKLNNIISYDGSNEINTKPLPTGHIQLLGTNGSGKSTFINIISGLETVPNEQVDVFDANTRVPDMLDIYSKGQNQLIVASVINKSKAEYIIIDEAFNSVDDNVKKSLYNKILTTHKNVIIVDHSIKLDIKRINIKQLTI